MRLLLNSQDLNFKSSALKYFLFDNKNSSNLGKFYLLPKIHKGLVNVPGRPVISNCGTPTEVSEFLDHLLPPVMRSGKSYIKDTSNFLEKIKGLGEVPEDAILVTADVVGLYPSIPHKDGLAILEKQLKKVPQKSLPTSEIVKLAEFVLKNNFFEFNGDIVHQVSGTAIGTKFAPSYACIFMDFIETQFLEGESSQPWVWLRYIDGIFFVWIKGEKELIKFMERLNKFHTNLKFTFDRSPDKINFLDLAVKLKDKKFDDIGLEISKVYINESLCKYNKFLWVKCKKLWKEKYINSFRTPNGQLKIRDNNLKTHNIDHLFDLQVLFPNYDFQSD